MKRQTKDKLKLFSCGVLTGAVILLSSNQLIKYKIKEKKNDFKDEFSLPRFEESFKDTRVVEQYSFDFYDGQITIESDELEIFSFDKKGNVIVERGQQVEVPIENNEYLLNEYITELESKVYRVLKIKDRIKDQYNVYVLFTWMEELYEEYLNRYPFDTLENRKEAIYKVCYDYVISEEGYTLGKYKFTELDKTIRKDILTSFKRINYMKENNKTQEESKFNEFIDKYSKDIKYKLLKKGRK